MSTLLVTMSLDPDRLEQVHRHLREVSVAIGRIRFVGIRPDGIDVRRAAPADAVELTRLRVLMFEEMGRDPRLLDDEWRRRNVDHFTTRLAATDRFAGFVVDKPDGGLAASAIGWLNDHLIGTANPTGRVGYIANISTDRQWRRRGCARATLTALLEWFGSNGIRTVNLHATSEGMDLYRSMGFIESHERSMILQLG